MAGHAVLVSGTRARFSSGFAAEIIEGRSKLEQLGGQELTLPFSKGEIDAMYFDLPRVPRKAVIFFPGMGEAYERIGVYEYSEECLVYQYLQAGFCVLLWNYPHVSRSTGSPTIDQVMESADVVLRYLTDTQDIQEHRILLHGHSMGGGLSVHFATQRIKETGELRYPKLNICNDRSYSHLSNALTTLAGKVQIIGPPSGWLASMILSKLCRWELDTLSNWNLPESQGFYWLIHHINDEMVPHHASLAFALQEASREVKVIELDTNNSCVRGRTTVNYEEIYDDVCHERPLTPLEWEQHLVILSEVFPDVIHV